MLEIDELREGDVPAALRLSTQAGWNQVEGDWRRLIGLWPGLVVGGRVEGELVATATVAQYGETGWVGMVLVEEGHRGRGYGGVALDAVMGRARACGVTRFGLDATGLGRGLYLKRGFRDVVGIERWVRERPGDLAAAGQGDVREMREADRDVVMELDRRAVGLDRERLLRHMLGEAGVRGWVCADERGGVRAYAVTRPGRMAACVGPVVGEGRFVEALLEKVLMEMKAERVLIDVPAGKLGEWLKGQGFEVKRELVRMWLGAEAGEAREAMAGPLVWGAGALELG